VSNLFGQGDIGDTDRLRGGGTTGRHRLPDLPFKAEPHPLAVAEAQARQDAKAAHRKMRESAEKFPMRAAGFSFFVLPTVSMTATAYAAGMYTVTGPEDAANKVSCGDVIKLPNGSWQANATFTDPNHKVTVNPVFGTPAEIEALDKRCGKQPEPEKR
jgi:hypothetical protein